MALLALAACADETPREELVVLQLAGRTVTLGELDRFVATSAHQESPFLAGDVMAVLFEDFIEEQLLLQAAEDAGIVADPRAVSRRMSAILAIQTNEAGQEGSIRTDDDALAETVEKQVRIERLLETTVLASLDVTDDEVAEFYEAHSEDFLRPETVDVSQILVEDEALAAELRERLRARESSFEELASEHSVGPEAERGGRLGAFTRGELPPSFEESVFGLGPGELSDVVATDFGYHIFKVNDRSEAGQLSLENVQDVIRVDLLRQKSDQAAADYLEDLRGRYPVVVHREHLSFALVDLEGLSSRRRAGGREK